MITRFGLFEGRVRDGMTAAFRDEVVSRVLPCWRAMPGVLDVRVDFEESRDDGAPPLPLILAISYPDVATMEAALVSPARDRAKEAMEDILERMFEGRLHHHVTVTAARGR